MPLAATLLALLQATSAPRPAERPEAVGWDDFPVFVWRETHAGKPPPDELVAPFGGVILMRQEDSAWARERGWAYLVWNVAGRDALHLDADEAWNARVERWIETHDEALLVREPCLNDPATRAELYATLDATLARHGEHPGLGFVLGDEVALTPNGDPFDLCRCGHCEAAWKAHAKPRGLPERAPRTDEVRVALLEDDFSLLGAWLARRRFETEYLTELVLELREHGIPGEAPERGWSSRSVPHVRRSGLRFGLLGGAGHQAFATFDLGGSGDLLDFVEAYPRVDAREQLLWTDHVARHGPHPSGGPPIASGAPGASLATVFVDEETPDGAAWQVWEHWLRGGRGVVLWSDAALERSPEHRERLARAVADVRRLASVYRPFAQRGGAIVHDPDSIAAAWLRDALLDGPTWPRRRSAYQAEHGTRERKVRSWLRWIEDAGRLPSGLPLAAVRGDCAHEYGFLVLAEILVVGDDDIAHLEAFVAEGGTLFVDGALGWVDREGRPRGDDVFERLRARARERVLRPPAELATWLERRLDGRIDARERARTRLDALLDESPRLPDLGPEARALPWLVARASLPGPERATPVLVLLPNLVTPAERRALRDVRLETGEDELTWIHPPAGEPLRAGDAAVLVPLRSAGRGASPTQR